MQQSVNQSTEIHSQSMKLDCMLLDFNGVANNAAQCQTDVYTVVKDGSVALHVMHGWQGRMVV